MNWKSNVKIGAVGDLVIIFSICRGFKNVNKKISLLETKLKDSTTADNNLETKFKEEQSSGCAVLWEL